MKKIFLLFTIIAISFACKKKSTLTINDPGTIKTTKSFIAQIQFTTDSLLTHYFTNSTSKGVIYITIDTVVRYNTGIQTSGAFFVGVPTDGDYNWSLYANQTSNDINKPFTYRINVKETIFRRSDSSVVYYYYSKIYTFHEGDNGIINFNTLP